jgi:hypothetical protein
MRKILVIFILFAIAGSLPALAQRFYSGNEYGFTVGGSQYFGDLNDNYGFHTIHPAYGVFLRTPFNPYISVRGGLYYTQVGYDDKYNTDPFEHLRNLNFTSNIFECSANAEFNFFRYSTGELNSRFTPYLTGGIGVFYYNPYTYLNGTKYYLRTLGTEGQDAGSTSNKYSNFAVCFPIGAGVKWWIRPGTNLGFEIVDRLTTTDYLDDVSDVYAGAGKFANNPVALALQDRSSAIQPNNPIGIAGKQRGNTSTFDQYLMAMVTVSFQFKVYRCPGYLKKGFLL